jgi:hypothetical protein
VPTGDESDQVTPVLEVPVTVAVYNWLSPALTLAARGETVTVIGVAGGTSVTTAETSIEGLAVDVAVTVTC